MGEGHLIEGGYGVGQTGDGWYMVGGCGVVAPLRKKSKKSGLTEIKKRGGGLKKCWFRNGWACFIPL